MEIKDLPAVLQSSPAIRAALDEAERERVRRRVAALKRLDEIGAAELAELPRLRGECDARAADVRDAQAAVKAAQDRYHEAARVLARAAGGYDGQRNAQERELAATEPLNFNTFISCIGKLENQAQGALHMRPGRVLDEWATQSSSSDCVVSNAPQIRSRLAALTELRRDVATWRHESLLTEPELRDLFAERLKLLPAVDGVPQAVLTC